MVKTLPGLSSGAGLAHAPHACLVTAALSAPLNTRGTQQHEEEERVLCLGREPPSGPQDQWAQNPRTSENQSLLPPTALGQCMSSCARVSCRSGLQAWTALQGGSWGHTQKPLWANSPGLMSPSLPPSVLGPMLSRLVPTGAQGGGCEEPSAASSISLRTRSLSSEALVAHAQGALDPGPPPQDQEALSSSAPTSLSRAGLASLKKKESTGPEQQLKDEEQTRNPSLPSLANSFKSKKMDSLKLTLQLHFSLI